ncbi:MAG TPA: alpha/beta fold hydrolase [Verrucomicrobiae bacterium]|nr:alpha/beta fold hydrolase [Verrucomicrobiae bacterium]
MIHSNALDAPAGFYRVARYGTPAFEFNWTGTNFTYSDSERTFNGLMLKPAGNGAFPAVIINHGAGGTVTGYSLTKAREMSPWGLVCIAPTLTHVAGGETNAPNMGHCPENIARAVACANVLAGLGYVDTNRVAIFGHSMGAFATIGEAAALSNRIRAAVITAGGVIPDSGGSTNAAPTVTEASSVRTPFLMFHCDADTVVPQVRSQLFQQMLNSNSVVNARILYSSNSIPNQNNWHNIHQDAAINPDVLTNTFQWLQSRGVLP